MQNEHIAPGDPNHQAGGIQVHHADGAHHADGTPYSDTERATFRNEDFAAGKAVVLLMLGIFSMGVVLYSAVAYFVAY